MLTDSQDSFNENIIRSLYSFIENRFSEIMVLKRVSFDRWQMSCYYWFFFHKILDSEGKYSNQLTSIYFFPYIDILLNQ